MARVAAALEARAQPAGREAVIAALAPMVTLYGVPDKTEAEWRAFWKFYADALGRLPIEAVKAGANAYVNLPDSEFFPKPGPLKKLCEKAAEELYTALGRARRAMTLDPASNEVLQYGAPQ